MAKNCIICNRKMGLFSSYFTLGDGSLLCKDCANKHLLYNLGVNEEEVAKRLSNTDKQFILNFVNKDASALELEQDILKDNPIQIGNYLFDMKAGLIFVKRTAEEPYRFFNFENIRSMRQHIKKQTYGRKHIVRNMVIGNLVAGNVGKYYAATHSPKKTIYNYLGEIVTFKDGSEYEFRAPVSTALIDSRQGKELKKQYDYMVQVLKEGKAQFKPKPKRRTRTKQVDPAKEIKELSDLAKQGIITQEEFEAKKKQLLNL